MVNKDILLVMVKSMVMAKSTSSAERLQVNLTLGSLGLLLTHSHMAAPPHTLLASERS